MVVCLIYPRFNIIFANDKGWKRLFWLFFDLLISPLCHHLDYSQFCGLNFSSVVWFEFQEDIRVCHHVLFEMSYCPLAMTNVIFSLLFLQFLFYKCSHAYMHSTHIHALRKVYLNLNLRTFQAACKAVLLNINLLVITTPKQK